MSILFQAIIMAWVAGCYALAILIHSCWKALL